MNDGESNLKCYREGKADQRAAGTRSDPEPEPK
jgi:hypothetical protein